MAVPPGRIDFGPFRDVRFDAFSRDVQPAHPSSKNFRFVTDRHARRQGPSSGMPHPPTALGIEEGLRFFIVAAGTRVYMVTDPKGLVVQ